MYWTTTTTTMGRSRSLSPSFLFPNMLIILLISLITPPPNADGLTFSTTRSTPTCSISFRNKGGFDPSVPNTNGKSSVVSSLFSSPAVQEASSSSESRPTIATAVDAGAPPNTLELREEIEKLGKSKSSSAPIEATKLLNELFDFYMSIDTDTNANEDENANANTSNNSTTAATENETEAKGSPNYSANDNARIYTTFNVHDCTKVIGAWSKSKHRDAPREALSILTKMNAIYNKFGGRHVRPNVVTYTSVIAAYAQRGDIEGASTVFEMQVTDFKTKKNYSAKPNARTFKTMINACTKSRQTRAPQTAEKILATLNDWHAAGQLKEGSCTITYSSVINCWTKSGFRESPQRARALLETMLQQYKTEGNEDVCPNGITYASVLDAYARWGDVDGAMEVWETMKEDYKSGNEEARPVVYMYTILIKAWAKSVHPNAPQEAEKLLQEVLDLYARGELEEGPNNFTYGTLINCWAKSQYREAPQRARDILESMIAQYKNGDERLMPNSVTYGATMDAYARKGDTKGAIEVFQIMKEDYESGNTRAKADVRIYGTLMSAHVRSGNKNAPIEVEKLLMEMVDLYSKGVLKEGPNTFIYGTLINCWSKSELPEAPRRAREILEAMITQYKKGDKHLTPDSIIYNSVLDACARQGDIEGANAVRKLMQDDFDSGNKRAVPNLRTYSMLIYAHSRGGKPNAPAEGEKLLEEMHDLYSKGKLREPPNTISHSIVINCWAKSDFPEGTQRARDILESMLSRYKDGTSNCKPNAITYHSVLDAYSRRGDIDGANEIWKIMMDDFHSGNGEARPERQTFSILIDTWSKSNKQQESPIEAEKLLQDMIDQHEKGDILEGPDAIVFSSVINCWAKSGLPESPKRARDILESMLNHYQYGNEKVRPNMITYNSVLDAYARNGDIKGALEIWDLMNNDYLSGNLSAEPNIPSYNTLINAWSKSNKQKEAPKEAEKLLKEMIDLNAKGDLKEGPSKIVYSTVINCWAKSDLPESPQRARDILESMIHHYQNGIEEVRPNTITYNSVLDAYARQGHTNGATEILKMMEDDFDAGNIDAIVDLRTYNILIDTWSKSLNPIAPQEAEKLIEKMTKHNINPTTISYTGVINAFGKSSLPDSHHRALAILEDMASKANAGNEDVRPNKITYNSVIDAFARKQDAEGANNVWMMMEKDYKSGNAGAKPDLTTYNTLMNAWCVLLVVSIVSSQKKFYSTVLYIIPFQKDRRAIFLSCVFLDCYTSHYLLATLSLTGRDRKARRPTWKQKKYLPP
uniref:Pentacotripeptide-repeat region of PRORP domain-containing protein n=2 Tax=Pseudo-nitzschia australis TaxID=44445 RepID=A0A7S4APZ8_9STRA